MMHYFISGFCLGLIVGLFAAYYVFVMTRKDHEG